MPFKSAIKSYIGDNRCHSNALAMLSILRSHLRKDGWTISRLSEELDVGEATVKRWLVGKGLTIDRLERIASLCGMVLGDLVLTAEETATSRPNELTLAQEKALASEIFLTFLFIALLNGIQPQEVAVEFNVPPDKMDLAMQRLERLAIIDRMQSGRVRVLIDRKVMFQKQPLRTLFERYMKQRFFELDYSAPETIYTTEVVKISENGAREMAELLQRQRMEVIALAEEDRKNTAAAKNWYGVMSVVRDLDMQMIRSFERPDPTQMEGGGGMTGAMA